MALSKARLPLVLKRGKRIGGGPVDAVGGSVLGGHDPAKALFKAGDDKDTSGLAPSEKSVIEFLRKNPRPKDTQFHEWAQGKGVNVHKAEATAYGILSDLLTKGRSKGKHPAGIADKDVSGGVKIEAEHTPNKEIQRKITDDHNTELKKYYDKKTGLPAMEKKLEKAAALPGTFRDTAMSKMKKATIVKPTGALRSNLGPMPKKAAFMEGFLDELEKAGAKISSKHYYDDGQDRLIKPGDPDWSDSKYRRFWATYRRHVVAPEGLDKELKKRAMEKVAGPPTLAKLRRAYPKGKVKPPTVADPAAATKRLGGDFPKAATLSGRIKYKNLRLVTKTGGVMDPLTKAFFIGLTDELEKKAGCDTPGEKIRSKGKGRGLVIGKGKGPLGIPKRAMDDGAGAPTALGRSIRGKIQAAKADPSTKANPKDTGPKGSGLQDPRAQAMKGRGFGKGAGTLSNALFEKVTGKKKKKLFGKGGLIHDTDKDSKKAMKKKADEAFIGGFVEGLGKDAATAVPKTQPKAVRDEVAGTLKGLRTPLHKRLFKDPEGQMAKGYRRTLQSAYK